MDLYISCYKVHVENYVSKKIFFLKKSIFSKTKTMFQPFQEFFQFEVCD